MTLAHRQNLVERILMKVNDNTLGAKFWPQVAGFGFVQN